MSAWLAILLFQAGSFGSGLAAPVQDEPSVDFRQGDLKVSENRRFLVHANGAPFFWLGDTAWELFHRLTREEAEQYLEKRRAQRFTVIQTVALAELDGLRDPNPYGHRPLLEDDPARPDVKDGPANDYWDHVDFIVDLAAKKGLVVGFLPTWGDKWNRKWGVGPVVFTPEKARAYGTWLGARYKDRPNLIWILGGDRNPENDGHQAVTREMAAGLRAGDGGRHLMTFHPQGGSTSSKWFHQDDWLATNMLQSGHGAKDLPNDRKIAADYAIDPPKPCLDGEPRYENHPVNWKAEKGWFDDFDVRQAAYWALFAGAHGHTYGCHDVWQMMAPGRKPISAARNAWFEVLDLPGANQMRHARSLLESLPFLSRVPDPSLVPDPGNGPDRVVACRGDGYALVYLPTGRSTAVTLGRLVGEKVKAVWFNPRDGTTTAGEWMPNSGVREFTPPSSGRGNDWVLQLLTNPRR